MQRSVSLWKGSQEIMMLINTVLWRMRASFVQSFIQASKAQIYTIFTVEKAAVSGFCIMPWTVPGNHSPSSVCVKDARATLWPRNKIGSPVAGIPYKCCLCCLLPKIILCIVSVTWLQVYFHVMSPVILWLAPCQAFRFFFFIEFQIYNFVFKGFVKKKYSFVL